MRRKDVRVGMARQWYRPTVSRFLTAPQQGRFSAERRWRTPPGVLRVPPLGSGLGPGFVLLTSFGR